jgi:hypothetical protein
VTAKRAGTADSRVRYNHRMGSTITSPTATGAALSDGAAGDLERRFAELVEKWRAGVYFTSSATVMVEHPAYQAIIRLGKPVVPLILRDLQRDPEWWFAVLTGITGEDPVRPEHAGRPEEMTADWLEHAARRGYV